MIKDINPHKPSKSSVRKLTYPGKRAEEISLSHAMRPGLKIRHFWVAKLLFLTIIFYEKIKCTIFCL